MSSLGPVKEWTVYDHDRDNFTFVRAHTQKEAIVKAMDKGFKPSSTDDARPRTGDTTLMSSEEFEEFMDG